MAHARRCQAPGGGDARVVRSIQRATRQRGRACGYLNQIVYETHTPAAERLADSGVGTSADADDDAAASPSAATSARPLARAKPGARRSFVAGLTAYSRKDLEQVVAEGRPLDLTVMGYCSFARDIPAELADAPSRVSTIAVSSLPRPLCARCSSARRDSRRQAMGLPQRLSEDATGVHRTPLPSIRLRRPPRWPRQRWSPRAARLRAPRDVLLVLVSGGPPWTTRREHPTAPTRPAKVGLLINRNFALLFFGGTISIVGDYVFNTTLVLWIAAVLLKGQAIAPLAVSGGLVAAALPVLLIGRPPGSSSTAGTSSAPCWRCRSSRPYRWCCCSSWLAVVRLPLPASLNMLPFAQGSHPPVSWTLGAIYAVVFVVYACNQFANPAAIALIGDVVEEPLRPRATGLDQVAFALAAIIGPPVAAPLLFSFGVQWAVVIDALSFVVAYVVVLAMRAPKSASSVAPGQRGHFLRELFAGIRFFAGNRVLRTLGLVGSLVFLAAGALNALDFFFWVGNVHGPVQLYGFVGGALAFGVLLGAALASAFVPRIGLERTVWLTFVALGVLVLVWSRMTAYVPALVVIFLVGIPQAALNVAISPLMLQVTPREGWSGG